MSRREPGVHRPERQRLIPLWRNERLPGTRITLPRALRAVLLAILVMAVVVAYAIWRLVDLGNSTTGLVKQYKATQDANHASRLEFEARLKAANAYTQAQVSKLACSVVAFTPPARSNAFVRSLASTYHCPPYRPPVSVRASVDPSVSVTLQFNNPAPPPSPSGSTTVSSAPATSTAAVSSPRPRPTLTRSPSAPVCLVALVCLP